MEDRSLAVDCDSDLELRRDQNFQGPAQHSAPALPICLNLTEYYPDVDANPPELRAAKSSVICTATTSPLAQTCPPALSDEATITLRPFISFTCPRTTSTPPSGVGRR